MNKMATVKEKILSDIQNITDEELLKQVYVVLQDLQGVSAAITLNRDQIANIQEARSDYKKGKYYSTDRLFNDLLND